MRILFVSNYFPPDSRGGYEQWCLEVAGALQSRGHELAVLTGKSTVAAKEDNLPFQVFRELNREVTNGLSSSIGRILRQKSLVTENLEQTRRILEQTSPEVVLIWGMWNIHRAVPALIERLMKDRVAYYFCDYWPSLPSAFRQQLQAPARRRYAAWAKRLLYSVLARMTDDFEEYPLSLTHPFFVSRAVRKQLISLGVRAAHGTIIYGGTDLIGTDREVPGVDGANRIRLVYVGRMAHEKGVHTAVESARILTQWGECFSIDFYGSGDRDYLARLERQVYRHGLQSHVRFRGSVDRAAIPGILEGYDVLLFPSEWEEPFARVALEAMAAGLMVIGTTTGGTGELLRDNENGLTFRAGDPEGLAAQIRRILHDPRLCHRLARAGRDEVRRNFSLERMVDDLEAAFEGIRSLQKAFEGPSPIRPESKRFPTRRSDEGSMQAQDEAGGSR